MISEDFQQDKEEDINSKLTVNKQMEKIYKKGRRKEYKIIEDLKKEGYNITQRTAGSHSPIDIIAINKLTRTIKLIQSKRTMKETMDYIDKGLKKNIEEDNRWLNNVFRVEFEVM